MPLCVCPGISLYFHANTFNLKDKFFEDMPFPSSDLHTKVPRHLLANSFIQMIFKGFRFILV